MCSVNFSIEDTTALEAEARTHTIEDAWERAAGLAEKMNIAIGAPIVI